MKKLVPLGAALLVLVAAAHSATHVGHPRVLNRVDKVVVNKRQRALVLLRGEQIIAVYRIALGHEPNGAKMREGDGRTPEGSYVLDHRNPSTRFHLSIHVSYPNEADRTRARDLGVPPGGDIMIHGLPNGLGWLGRLHRLLDWTNGCIAVTDTEIDEIWQAVPEGTPIEILP